MSTVGSIGAAPGGRAGGALVCVDAGQSGVRVQVRDEGRVLSEATHPGIDGGRDTMTQLVPVLAAALTAATGPVAGAAIGASGLRDDVDAAALLAAVPGLTRVHLAHDSVTGYLAAIGDVPGVVVAAGTGVVTLAVGPARVARVDGWGHLLGDAGSGFWIGRRALDAVLRAHDGRGAPTALTAAVRERWPSLDDLALDVQADPGRVAAVASLARTVADLTETDPVAASITRAAAIEVTTSVTTALRVAGQDGPTDPAVGLVGNVFRSAALRAEVHTRVRTRYPNARFAPDAGDVLGGVALLPAVAAAGGPLASRITTHTIGLCPSSHSTRS